MYRLPITLGDDIAQFASLASDYEQKKIEAVQFKAFRVPMGIYEQRQDEVYMSRVRTTGGVIYPQQLLRLIDIARAHGSNLLHITTRQEIQIQNLRLEEVEPVLKELQAIGLSTKGGGGNTIRNILVSEESGIALNEVFDTTPHAMQLTSKLIAEPDSFLLPRKMKIAFSSDEKQIGYAAVNDIGFVAKEREGERGFLVYAGGGAGSKPTIGWVLFDFIPEKDLFAVVQALKTFFSEYGNRKNRNQARLRYVFYKLGEEETIRLIRKQYKEALRTEVPFVPEALEEERPEYQYSPESGNADDSDVYRLWKKRYVIRQRQRGYNSVLLPFLLGNIRLDEQEKLKEIQALLLFIQQFGQHTLRFTTTQNIRLRNIPDEALPDLFLLLKGIVSDINAPVLVNNIVSCTGADTCRLGIGLSKGLANAIRKELLHSKLNLDSLETTRIHISGCPNSCGQQLWADIGFSGKILRNDRIYPGYQVYLAANREQAPQLAEPIGHINARDIPRFVHRLLETYLTGEHQYTNFPAYLKGDGKAIAQQLLAEYKEVPSFADDKNYYFDWGAESIFSVIGRGTAECSAGLFDMIDVDLSIIKQSKKALEEERDPGKRNKLLYEIIHSSSRMLLVTRGLEPKSTPDVFHFFIRSFIEYGFVDERFREIVVLARDDRSFDFETRTAEVYALSETVEELYRNMDDSLQFKNVQAKAKPAKEEAQAAAAPSGASKGERKFKDLRGVACPMNFVQTKIQLAPMQPGQLLEIWLDDGAPINNVPNSVRGEGHEVLEQTPVDSYWKVIIKKK